MPTFWPVVDASSWRLAGVESQGQNQHNWYSTTSQPRSWLFKPSRPERHRAFGEETAEKLASEIAGLLGVPAAPVQLAVRDGGAGALIEDVRPSQWELQLGQALMPEVVNDYDPADGSHRGYSPRMIRAALERFDVPPHTALPDSFRAFDTFTGYLIFDALTAHGDRHDRNWAVLIPPPGDPSSETLCASFDHAASMGFNLFDHECEEHLVNRTVGEWARKGKAQRFERTPRRPRQSLVELAGSAARLCSIATRNYWRERISSVGHDDVARLVAMAPGLTDSVRNFLVELLLINKERVLDELG